MRKMWAVASVALCISGCTWFKSSAPTASGGMCANQGVDPTCAALVAGAFCQAKARPEYGACEVYSVSRGFEILPADKGKRLKDMTLSLGAAGTQTCQTACEVFGVALEGSGKGWQAVLNLDGNPLGIADLGAGIRGDNKGRIATASGRPDSVYLQQDTPYADWCCCARGCGVPPPAKKRAVRRKR